MAAQQKHGAGNVILAVLFIVAVFGGIFWWMSSPEPAPKAEPVAVAKAPDDPDQDAKDVAAGEAIAAVTQQLKDPSSADFGDVVGRNKSLACGSVNSKNSFGAMTGQTRFIYMVGLVKFDDGRREFDGQWKALCEG